MHLFFFFLKNTRVCIFMNNVSQKCGIILFFWLNKSVKSLIMISLVLINWTLHSNHMIDLDTSGSVRGIQSRCYEQGSFHAFTSFMLWYPMWALAALPVTCHKKKNYIYNYFKLICFGITWLKNIVCIYIYIFQKNILFTKLTYFNHSNKNIEHFYLKLTKIWVQ